VLLLDYIGIKFKNFLFEDFWADILIYFLSFFEVKVSEELAFASKNFMPSFT
jgi:hypothetical protein